MVAIIPARRGSSLIGKNLRKIHGRSLIERAIDCAEASALVSADIVVTSDCPFCLALARMRDCVAIERPWFLADDHSPTILAVAHALRELRLAGREPDAVALLQPTNPLRLPEDVDQAITILSETGCGSVHTVAPAHCHPARQLWADTGRPVFVEYATNRRRQDLPPVWDRDGSVYLTRVEYLDRGTFYAPDGRVLVLPKERHLDVEDAHDLRIAAALLQRSGHRH